MIRNGRPYTNENRYADSELLTDMSEEEQRIVLEWIKANIKPIKTANNYHTSYGIKHILQSDTDIYTTNNQFKDAMMMCGHYPVNPNVLNWNFRISQRSPAFNWKKRRKNY